jgi:hypothetical protein
MDAIGEGFRTCVALDATRGITPPSCEAMRLRLEASGVLLASADEISAARAMCRAEGGA